MLYMYRGYAYSTGFWCAVLSAILASLNAMVLVVYAAYMRRAAWKDNRRIQVQGRHFVVSSSLTTRYAAGGLADADLLA